MKRLLGILLAFAFIISVAMPGIAGAEQYVADTDFNIGNGFDNFVEALALQNDGKVLVGGAFGSYDGVNTTRVTRLNSDGSFDAGFVTGTGFNNSVKDFAVQSDGKIIVGGYFTSYNGSLVNRIVRLNPDGSRDLTFVTGTGFAGGSPEVLLLQDDGKLLVGGSFTSYDGATTSQIVRLNSDGSLDASFDTGTGFSADFGSKRIYALALQDDGKIVAGGQVFTSYNGNPASRIIRLNSDGSMDQTFALNPGFDNTVNTLVLQNDGKILAGGSFTSYNGNARSRIARLNSNGTLDNTFNPGSGFDMFDVNSLVLQGDGKILAGGSFTGYDGTTTNRIARINTNGSLDGDFLVGAGFDNIVYELLLQSDGNLLVAGDFTSFASTQANKIIRLVIPPEPATVPDAPFGLTATAVSSSEIDLSWNAPLDDGGSAIIGYKIERKMKNNEPFVVVVANTGNTNTSYTDSGLEAKKKYTYRVSAINDAGVSTPSNEASAKTLSASKGSGNKGQNIKAEKTNKKDK